jgi:hypothetical protein
MREMSEDKGERSRFRVGLGHVGGRSGVLRFCIGVLVAGIAAAAISPERVSLGLAIIVLTACFANAARIVIQLLGDEYFVRDRAKIAVSIDPKARKHLNALVLGNIALTLVGVTGGVMLIAHPNAPLLCRVLPVGAFCAAFFALTLAIVERASVLEVKRGTEIVRKSDSGSWLFKITRTGKRFRPVKLFLDAFDRPTPENEPSQLALIVATALLFAPITAVDAEMDLSVANAAVTWIGHRLDDLEGKASEPTARDEPQSPGEEHDASGVSAFRSLIQFAATGFASLLRILPGRMSPPQTLPIHRHETWTIRITIGASPELSCRGLRARARRRGSAAPGRRTAPCRP